MVLYWNSAWIGFSPKALYMSFRRMHSCASGKGAYRFSLCPMGSAFRHQILTVKEENGEQGEDSAVEKQNDDRTRRVS